MFTLSLTSPTSDVILSADESWDWTLDDQVTLEKRAACAALSRLATRTT